MMDFVLTSGACAHVQLWRKVCLWCLCTVLVAVRAACPDNALNKAMMCTQGLMGMGIASGMAGGSAFVEKGQVQVAKEACRSNKLMEAIQCLEALTDVCQGSSDQEHFLRNMINVKGGRGFITFFCSHLDEYERHAPCIARMHGNLTKCSKEQRKNMVIKLKASENMDFLMSSGCKYFYAAELCSHKILTQSCSPAAANMVAGVFTGFKPPLCDSITDAGSQDDDAGSRSGFDPDTGSRSGYDPDAGSQSGSDPSSNPSCCASSRSSVEVTVVVLAVVLFWLSFRGDFV